MEPRGSQLAFIVGQRKSGSTWLANLLSLHPAVRGLKETHLVHHTAVEADPRRLTEVLFGRTPWGEAGAGFLLRHHAARALRPLLRQRRPALALAAAERPAGRLDLPPMFRRALRRRLLASASGDDYCRRFFAALHERLAPPAYLLEKSPSHVFHSARLRALFPDAKLLCIHRDGRDVAVSEQAFAPVHEGRRPPIEESFRGWRRAIEHELAAGARDGVYRCSYEELAADPAGALRRILAFLALPAGDALVADMVRRASFEFQTGRAPGEERRRSFYRKGLVGDWRERLSAEERELFKEIAGDLLIALGYERDDRW